jgi:signal transduction histidine kinase
MTYLGNSINIAGKNRFLTSDLMYNTAEYFIQNNSDTSKINAAINELESNILTLKNGGEISDINLKPLPSEFSNDWNIIYQRWILLKTILSNNISKENQMSSTVLEGVSETTTATSIASTTKTTLSQIEIDKIVKTIFETGAVPLVNSSNVLVTKLGEYAKDSSEYSIFLQRLFAILNMGVTTAFVLYIARKILKPIFALTHATSEVKAGNLNVSVENKDHDELSALTESFNTMVVSIKNYIKKQNELKKELEKANEELKHRDQLRDEFINVAAHELKTPIQPILGLCELLRDRETDIIRDQEILDIIIRNSKRLLNLTEDVLNVTRIEQGNLILNKEKFNFKEMILEILNDFNQKIIESKKDIQLAYEFNDGASDIIINADRNRINQVIFNLLNNALNFTNKGNITIIVERKKGDKNNNDKDNDQILISIKDTGIGICQEMLPKLFTKFATRSISGGTGLGLFISKSIIEMHGGKICANNNAVDNGKESKGSTFTFTIPLQ